MKQYVKYQTFVVPKKIKGEIRIAIDDRGVEYVATSPDGNKSTTINFYPIVSISITRSGEKDENGNFVKPPFNPNDTLGMTKFNLPLLVNNLKKIREDLNQKELYTYQGKRLELNETIAEKIRNPFVVGNMTVELSAVVIVQPDDTRIEGIKMKFNNEQSSVLLTINELETMIFNLDHLDIDSVSLLLYLNYITKPSHPTSFNQSTLSADVDIKPKESDFL